MDVISRARLDELRFLLTKNPNAYVSEVTDEFLEALDTLSALYKVLDAAKELRDRAYLMSGYTRKLGDAPAIIQLKDLEIALAPFDEAKEK